MQYDPIGGMQTQIYMQSCFLSKQNIDQVIITTGMPSAQRVWNIDNNTVVNSVGLKLLNIRSEVHGLVGFDAAFGLGGIAWLIRKVLTREKFDIVHSHCSGVVWPLVLGIIASKLFNLPLVFTIHCSNQATYVPMSTIDRIENILRKKLEKWAIEKSDLVITLTERLRSFYLSQGVTPQKVVKIPDCIDIVSYSALNTLDNSTVARKFGLSLEKKIVTYVGRVAIEKGWTYFVEMASNLRDRDIHFVVCGDGNQGDKLSKLVEKKGMKDRFTVTGFVPIQDVVGILKLTSVLVLPSIHEEFGSVTLEAMAVGCPVVASGVGGITEVIKHDFNGLISTPKSPEELARNVERIIDDNELAKRLTAQGYRSLRENYDLQTQMERLKTNYNKILKYYQ